MKTAEEKNALRRKLRAARKAIPAEVRARLSSAVEAHVLRLPAYAACRCLLTYVSVGTEVDTRDLIAQALAQGKQVAVPRCEGEHMAFFRIDSLADLAPGFCSLPEPPVTHPASFGADTLCLVPGLSFDRFGGRIGYGGGYYDRFLPSFPGTAAGLCFSPLLSAQAIPMEAHDVRMRYVVTEKGALDIAPAGE